MTDMIPLPLSARENGILTLTMSGLTDKEVAAATQLSIHTVRTYWDRIREKMSAGSRAEVIAKLASRRAVNELQRRESDIQSTKEALALKRAELAAIDAQRTELEEIVGKAPQASWARLPNGDVYFANDKFYEYLGLPHGEPVNTFELWDRIIHEADRVNEETTREAIEQGLPLDIEVRIKQHDGGYRWHLIRSIPIFDDEGNEVRRVGTAIDIHDLRKQTSSAADLDERLRIICELAPIGIAFFDPVGKTSYSNKVHTQISGAKLSPDNASRWWRTVSGDDQERTREAWEAAVTQGVAFQGDIRFTHQDGKEVWAFARAVPIRPGDPDGYVLLLEKVAPKHQDGNERTKLLKLAALLEDVLESSVGK